MKHKIKLNKKLSWKYETDEYCGTCVISQDEMKIKFVFEYYGKHFYDVLDINRVIEKMLKNPVSVESTVDILSGEFPKLMITAIGRTSSHGWITVISWLDNH